MVLMFDEIDLNYNAIMNFQNQHNVYRILFVESVKGTIIYATIIIMNIKRFGEYPSRMKQLTIFWYSNLVSFWESKLYIAIHNGSVYILIYLFIYVLLSTNISFSLSLIDRHWLICEMFTTHRLCFAFNSFDSIYIYNIVADWKSFFFWLLFIIVISLIFHCVFNLLFIFRKVRKSFICSVFRGLSIYYSFQIVIIFFLLKLLNANCFKFYH